MSDDSFDYTEDDLDYISVPMKTIPFQEWQPIETAPRDGTPILAYGCWAGEIAGPDKNPGTYVIAWDGGRTDYAGYEWRCQNTDACAAWVAPTHWMPLPKPPGAA